ncbi:uncharacterized protein [Takifugu rubripes]|uniref:Si:dkey-86e18.1 n=1 Tax=Takifugu rubripes TaxID=31033 RepID=A0A674MBN9_TAKRU|nr:uncharacterized protein LOC101074522 [Takifugu rubripes]|eukprot:XP_011613040.1 PREDICTED: uncharacterized protein LOC101074522 [Takifugu rubripes]
MARNEEKQQGRLNRLWLQKEREEGRLKNVHERRPKLSTLNSATSVKKWIPSIKSEIEYYLRQSQLSHYPERKITEFQQNIDALEKEYKKFIAKLRVLDPSCKHKPWTPRPYCKRRGASQESAAAAIVPRTGYHSTLDGPHPSSPPRTLCQDQTPPPVCEDQDQPLSFDCTRLAVATAAFRGPLNQLGSSQTQSMVKVLQSSLPNLGSSSRQSSVSQSRGSVSANGKTVAPTVCCKLQYERKERTPGKPSTTGTTRERTAHVLGLDCYSSSDEACDT